MKTKIEIKVKKLDKTLAGLVQAMGDSSFEGVVTEEIISFLSEKPDEWQTDERMRLFEQKLNAVDDNFYYNIVSVSKVFI